MCARHWSPAELAYLAAHYPHEPASAIAAHLHRSEQAVRCRASRTAVRCYASGDLTLHDVAAVLGRSRQTVRGWLTAGTLPARRGATGRPADADFWHVAPKDVRAFVKHYPAEVDGCRCDMVWLLHVLLGD
jgi:Helix-turn-helix domain